MIIPMAQIALAGGFHLALLRQPDHLRRPIDRQGMSSFMLPPIPYGLFKKNSRLPSAASAY